VKTLLAALALLGGCSAVTDADLDRLGGTGGDADADVDVDVDVDTDADADGDAHCGTGTVQCDGGCFDLATDPDHCGGCDRRCGEGEACVSGVCRCQGTGCSCAQGETNCSDGPDLDCHDLHSDPENCGGCGRRCEGATAVCVDTLCGVAVLNCDVCRDGARCCEIDGAPTCFFSENSPCN
jgi:stigma-specific protein Stig1